MRYVLDIRFKGTGYSGWQVQPNAVTIQSEVDRALRMILRHPVECYGAGRTDAGVHALTMPTHFDYPEELHPRFQYAMNSVLPRQIAVMQVYKAATEDFHVRFSPVSRAYRYQIIFQKDPMLDDYSFLCKDKLDIEAMQRGAAIIPEYDSFESFCKSGGNNKTFFCEIMGSHFSWEGDVLVYHIKANRFLRGMVRAVVGTLLEMGKGKLDEAGLRKIIEGKDRRAAGSSAVAEGLFLSEVNYPEGMLIPWKPNNSGA